MMSALIRIGMAVFLTTTLPIKGWSANTSADMGEQTAADYRAKHPECLSVIQYGKEPKSIGHVTGNPEKDTVAYPVERTRISCPSEQKNKGQP